MDVQNKGTRLFVCVTPQETDLTPVQFAALTYIEISCLTDVPALTESFASMTAMCMDGTKLSGVGSVEDSDFEISAFYREACLGQTTIRNAVGNNVNYAFKLVRADAVTGRTPTNIYARAKLRAKTFGSNSGVDEFVADTYTATISQGPVFVLPTTI